MPSRPEKMIPVPWDRFRPCTLTLRGPYEHYLLWETAVAVSPLTTALFFAKGVKGGYAHFTEREHKVFLKIEKIALKVESLRENPGKDHKKTHNEIHVLLGEATPLCEGLTRLLQDRDVLAEKLNPVELELHLNLEQGQWDQKPYTVAKGAQALWGGEVINGFLRRGQSVRFSWLRIEGRNIPFGSTGLHLASPGPIHTRGPRFLNKFMQSSSPLCEGDWGNLLALPIDPLPPSSDKLYKLDVPRELFVTLVNEQFFSSKGKFQFVGSSRTSLRVSIAQIKWLEKYGDALVARRGEAAAQGKMVKASLAKWKEKNP